MIPRSVNDLTVEFFSSILGCPVASFSFEEGTTAAPMQGNTSVLSLVTINFSSPLTFPPRRLFLKFALPVDDADTSGAPFARQLFIDAQVYRKELLFYRLAKEQLDMLPPVYYAEIEDAGGMDHFLLVMGEAGEPQNQILGCPLETSRLIVSQLARFHSQFINSESEQPAAFNPLYSPSHNILNQIIKPDDQSLEGLLHYSLEHFESKFDDFCIVAEAMASKSGDSDSLSADLSSIKSRFTDKSIFSDVRTAFTHNFISPAFRTLIHGDFRLDNILFDPQSKSVKFIDFQAVHYGNPAYDLAQFIVQCHDDHPAIFDEFVDIYYKNLCEINPNVAQLCSLEEFLLTVRSAIVFQVLLLSFHLAPLKPLIGQLELPQSMGRFMHLIALINKRALKAYLKI